MTRRSLLILVALCALPASASAADDRIVIRGAGWGHGVGMSQYGAKGLSEHGKTHREILAHFYTGTELGTVDPKRTVRVLLASSPTASFTGATRAAGRRLSREKTYRARRRGSAQVDLLSPAGRRLATTSAPLRVTGSRLSTGGKRYRGALEIHPGTFSGVDVVNAVRLEDYVRGVVSRESPSSWPIEALKAQAVAARTYAITTSRGGTFDHYRDVRSQVYDGVAAETPSTDRAVAETRGEVVTYDGQPVITYFFSTSGGRTENVENTSLGNAPRPWLKSVEDPYDDGSPHHRWGPIRLTFAQIDRKLGNLVKGKFEGIKVIRRGVSPRIVVAEVIGSQGRTRTTGAVLRARLGLRDTWAYFTAIRSGEEEPPEPDETPTPENQAAGDPSGGTPPGSALASRFVARRPIASIAGHVIPARRGSLVVVEQRIAGRWVAVGSAVVRRKGRYRHAVTAPGRYRVRAAGAVGPSVRIRRPR